MSDIKVQETPLAKVRGWSMTYFLEQNKKTISFLLAVFSGIFISMLQTPEGVSPKGWNLFGIFVATILGVVLKPLPMGAVALLSIGACIITNTLTFEEAFSGFSSDVVWLIVMAFFIARGFIITGLGSRLAYFFMGVCGKSTLGLSYGILATDLLLAPTIPSVTARAGGIIYPILRSVAKAFQSDPADSSRQKIGAFLVKVAFQGSAVTSAMFLTSMAGNPLIAQLASQSNISITWGNWALAALVPGLASLLVIPYLIYKIYPPQIKSTPHAKEFSKEKLAEMGKMKSQEYWMLFTFGILIVLWVFGAQLKIKAGVAALVGVALLILTGVLKWNDVLEEKGAWDTLFWFAALVTMASYLNRFGLATWFSNVVVHNVQGLSPYAGFAVLSLLYFYSHYFFASNLAHIGAMYAPFLIVAVALGVPPYLAALILAFFSSLFGGLTHYGSGPAPILFGSGYVSIGKWWQLGALVSLVNITIWILVGGIWWKFLGLW